MTISLQGGEVKSGETKRYKNVTTLGSLVIISKYSFDQVLSEKKYFLIKKIREGNHC